MLLLSQYSHYRLQSPFRCLELWLKITFINKINSQDFSILPRETNGRLKSFLYFIAVQSRILNVIQFYGLAVFTLACIINSKLRKSRIYYFIKSGEAVFQLLEIQNVSLAWAKLPRHRHFKFNSQRYCLIPKRKERLYIGASKKRAKRKVFFSSEYFKI